MSELFTPTVIELKIGAKLISVDPKLMSEEEQAVFFVIYENPHITERQIANTERWMGCHEKFESELPIVDKTETTLRRVRQIIRNLRLNHKCPILSDTNGYWIPSKEEEVSKCLERMEGQARSSAKAYMITYHELKSTFAVKSEYFDAQIKLFSSEEMEEEPAEQQSEKPAQQKVENKIGVGEKFRFIKAAFEKIPTAADHDIHIVERIADYASGRQVYYLVNGTEHSVHETWIEKV